MKKTKVLCCGEAVIDRIRNKKNEEFTDFLGGAPANVACALRKLNIDSIFIGSLGNDEFGKKFIEKFSEISVNINFLQLDSIRPTRIVKVNRDNLGDRYFSGFDAKSQTVFADEALNQKLIEKDLNSLEKLLLETKYLVLGTVLLSSSISSESIYFLIDQVKKFDVKIIIDLNWREVFWNHSTCSSKISHQERVKLIRQFLKCANILKLAKEEANLFFKSNNPLKISKTLFNKADVIVTDGSNPISWFINGMEGTTEVFNSSEIVDTTGAGDAFLAGLISKLIFLDFSSDEFDIQNCVKFASACGFLTCLGEGAIEQQPTFQKVNQFLGSQIL